MTYDSKCNDFSILLLFVDISSVTSTIAIRIQFTNLTINCPNVCQCIVESFFSLWHRRKTHRLFITSLSWYVPSFIYSNDSNYVTYVNSFIWSAFDSCKSHDDTWKIFYSKIRRCRFVVPEPGQSAREIVICDWGCIDQG